ncbi:MAG: hypothetical protein UX71_C0001G0105 [Parcubacteria group bacterium GW2011_GWA1_47_10]|uniref:Uncharacterized protein n=1 Tax=Candidatus Nomurabacteria bacterium GW2011_GWB1_47_6 TaxID=1618749 RepID=A0A0G1T0Z4_9BACT|nr:MAG: hypothetical protein UX71_C0001G0105 [Parcubacteria group bacterium GW2011_GWA1_47_10]KKU75496.1 MAG: hypothetical protein UY01_C0011G0003 [Candidatus Nomurabacteria bacterium GW2011_GWB1_47_6]
MAVSTALRLVPVERRDARWLQLLPEAGRRLLFLFSSYDTEADEHNEAIHDRGKCAAVVQHGLGYLYEHCSERTWNAVVWYLDSDLDLETLFKDLDVDN